MPIRIIAEFLEKSRRAAYSSLSNEGSYLTLPLSAKQPTNLLLACHGSPSTGEQTTIAPEQWRLIGGFSPVRSPGQIS